MDAINRSEYPSNSEPSFENVQPVEVPQFVEEYPPRVVEIEQSPILTEGQGSADAPLVDQPIVTGEELSHDSAEPVPLMEAGLPSHEVKMRVSDRLLGENFLQGITSSEESLESMARRLIEVPSAS